MNAELTSRIEAHGRQLLAIFPNATEPDPVKLCKKLRRLESRCAAIAIRTCNGPEFAEGEQDQLADALLREVNTLLGQPSPYQPKTGAACGCKRGVQRDNCPNCEGTGMVIDFKAIRARSANVPIFLNLDPRGYALKIPDEYVRKQGIALHQDWGGYGIIAPDLRDAD